jgi:hypothetical protein
MIPLLQEINGYFQPRHLPACHWKSPRHKEWLARVEQLESEGLDRSDAQSIADMEMETTKTTEK